MGDDRTKQEHNLSVTASADQKQKTELFVFKEKSPVFPKVQK
jgi:hypothetical protein